MPRLLAGLLLFWAGLLFGVSFLATPAKFSAPSLELAAAIDVGRQTFRVLNWAEMVLALGALAMVFGAPSKTWVRAAVVLAAALVALETVWLLPFLDSRAEVVIQGGTPPPSSLHVLYIAADVAKLFLLLAAGAGAIASERSTKSAA